MNYWIDLLVLTSMYYVTLPIIRKFYGHCARCPKLGGNLLPICVLFFFSLSHSQAQSPRDNNPGFHRLTFNARGVAFVSYTEDPATDRGGLFDFNDQTQLYGLNLGVNYNFLNGLSLGICTGREFFNQPEFGYYPIYLRAAMNGGTSKNSIHAEVSFGGQLTNENRTGVLARFFLGYRFRVIRSFFADLSMVYTFQNLYRSFEDSSRNGNHYNFESVGLSLGIDIN